MEKTVLASPRLVSDRLQAQFYDSWVRALRFQSRYSEAVKVASSERVRKLIGPEALTIRLNLYLILHRQGKVKEARQLCLQAREQAQAANDLANLVKAYNLLSIIEIYIGNYLKALAFARQALGVAEERNDPEDIHKACANIVIACDNLDDRVNWVIYVKRNLEAIQKGLITRPDRMIQTYNAMGEYYRKTGGARDEAAFYYEQALNISASPGISQPEFDAITLMNLGALYTGYDEAKARLYLEQAKALFEQEAETDKTMLPEFYQHFAYFWQVYENREQASHYYRKALNKALSLSNWTELRRASGAILVYPLEMEIIESEIIKPLKKAWRAWLKVENHSELALIANTLAELYEGKCGQNATPAGPNHLKRQAREWKKRALVWSK